LSAAYPANPSAPPFESVQYRASIDVIGKHLSGILVFKTQADSSIRTVFVNEMGVTFFDISFFDQHYKFNAIMKSMDKKAVRLSLAKDLGMILMRGIFKNREAADRLPSSSLPGEQQNTFTLKLKRKGTVRYVSSAGATQYPVIENFGKNKKVISIGQFYQADNPVPDSIFVQHHTVNFTISLKQLHATE
jgi:hypothetical protein